MELNDLRHRLKNRLPLTEPRPYDWKNWKPVTTGVRWSVQGFKSINAVVVNGEHVGIKLSPSEAAECIRTTRKLTAKALKNHKTLSTCYTPLDIAGHKHAYIAWNVCKMLVDAGCTVLALPWPEEHTFSIQLEHVPDIPDIKDDDDPGSPVDKFIMALAGLLKDDADPLKDADED